MANVIHISKNDGKKMVQMYHKGVPYFKDKKKAPRLPEWLQEVEYLESTGIQYIDTNLYLEEDFDFHIDFEWLDNKVNYNCISTVDGNTYWGIYVSNNNDVSINALNATNIYTNCRVSPLERYQLSYNIKNNVAIFNLNNISFTKTNITGLFPNDRSVVIIGNKYRVDKSGVRFLISLRCFDSHIVIKGSDAFHGIPCRFKTSHTCIDGNTLQEVTIPANKPCMYDMVTGYCFFNQGTGADFIVGPDHDTMVEVVDNTGIVGIYSKGQPVRDVGGG